MGSFGRSWSATLRHCLSRGSVVLGKGGGDEGRRDTASLAARMCQQVAHGMHPTPLPGGVQHLGGGGFQPFMRIGDCQLDAAQAAPSEGAEELGPEGLGLRGADGHPEHLAAAVVIERYEEAEPPAPPRAARQG